MTDFPNASALIEPAAAPGTGTRPLPNGHRMEEFEITSVLGVGGFGIVYRAFDHALERVVAIKEYMPAMLAERQGDLSIALRGDRFAATFKTGQAGFINEARLLAKFDHPGLIKVLRFWEGHGTAYMATPYYEGLTLKQRLAGGRALSEAEIMRMLAALLGALETLHRAQCFHRDIALDNILIQPDGTPVLLDFGSARKLIGDLVDDSSIMLKPGYSPIEQYTDDPAFRQGPWTDIYALGAVMHILVSGQLPPAAVVRSISDSYQPLEGSTPRYSTTLLRAADAALRQRIEERPQSVAAFAALLGLSSATPGHYSAADSVTAPARVAAPSLLPTSVTPATPAAAAAPGASATPAYSAPQPAPAGAQAAERADGHPAQLKGAARHGARPWILGAGTLVLAAAAWLWMSSNQPEPVNVDVPPQQAVAGDPAPAQQELPPPSPVPVPDAAPAPETPSAPAAPAAADAAAVYETTAADGRDAGLAATSVAPADTAPMPALPDETSRKPVRIALNISPWGEVYVNGKARGISPPMKSLQLPPGTYSIEVRNGKLPAHRQQLQVNAGDAAADIVHAFKSAQP